MLLGVSTNMHLAIVSPYPPLISGIGQYGYHISRMLAECGGFSKITVLCGTVGSPRQIDPDHSPAPLSVIPGWGMGNWNTGWQISSHLDSLKPDMTWFNLGASVFGKSPLANLSGFLSVSRVCSSGMPTTVTLHELPELSDLRALKAPGGIFSLYGARLLANLITGADVVCLTMQRYVDWLSRRRPGPCYLHIPTEAYYPSEKLPEPASPALLFFSTFAPFKGIETLLEAFRVLQAEYPALRLIIAGTEHPRFPDYPLRVKTEYGGIPNVDWLGRIPESQVRSLFQRASVVVLPYRASTGSSSVLMQAAAWGKSIVASDLQEMRSTVRDIGLAVTFFREGLVADLVMVLKGLLDSTEKMRSQAVHNLGIMRSRGAEAMCRAYLQAFDMAMDAHRDAGQVSVPVATTTEHSG